MTTIYLGKKRRNNSFLYRVEAGKNIVSGTYAQVLEYVGNTFGGSRVSIDWIGREYLPLNKGELIEFEKRLKLNVVLERKSPEIEPAKDFGTDEKELSRYQEKGSPEQKKYGEEDIYEGQEEWSKKMKETIEWIKKFDR